MRGFTFYICFGKPVKPNIDISSHCLRIAFFWVSVTFVLYDIEQIIVKLKEKAQRLERSRLGVIRKYLKTKKQVDGLKSELFKQLQ